DRGAGATRLRIRRAPWGRGFCRRGELTSTPLIAIRRQWQQRTRPAPPPDSVLHVHPQPPHRHRPTIAVVPGVPDVLNIRTQLYVVPKLGAVVDLQDLFRSVAQPSIPEQKANPTIGQILAMRS